MPKQKITVVTRDNIRTLKPHPEDMPRELGPPGQVGWREAVVMSMADLEKAKVRKLYGTPGIDRANSVTRI